MSVMNKEELSELILENQKEMYVLACSILKNQADAQDAVSECIVRAFENRTSLKKRTSARSWLMKILINVSRSAITKRQKVVLFADPEQYEQEAETAEDHLWSVILELPENVRVVMVLYYYEGFSVREISTLLDIPEGTTKTRLSSGRKQLAKWIEDGKERGHVI
ncbi:RNA polymerase sigma factor [Eubacterium ramulus]